MEENTAIVRKTYRLPEETAELISRIQQTKNMKREGDALSFIIDEYCRLTVEVDELKDNKDRTYRNLLIGLRRLELNMNVLTDAINTIMLSARIGDYYSIETKRAPAIDKSFRDNAARLEKLHKDKMQNQKRKGEAD